MVTLEPLKIEDQMFTAITAKLPNTNLLMIASEKGYIMCGALDVDLLNKKLSDRNILAGRAVGVRTIHDLLEAPLESVTNFAKKCGIYEGMIGKEALLKMV